MLTSTLGDEGKKRQLAYLPFVIGGALLLATSVLYEGPFLVLGLVMFAIPLLWADPSLGFMLAYPVFFLIPYGAYRIDAIVLNSPLNVIVWVTILLGTTNLLLSRRKLLLPPLLLLVASMAGIYGFYAIAGHGEVATSRFWRFVQGLWPMLLMLLTVDLPKKIKSSVNVICITFLMLSLFWIYQILGAGAGRHARMLTFHLAGGESTISYLLMLAIAMFIPIPFSLALSNSQIERRQQFLFWSTTCACILFVLVSSYAAAIVGVGIGMLVVGLLAKVLTPKVIGMRIVLVALLVFIWVVFMAFQTTVDIPMIRLVEYERDASASYRMLAMSEGLKAFLESPIFGTGAYDRPTYTSEGHLLGGHISIVVMAYEFGLSILAPFLCILLIAISKALKLVRSVPDPLDKALAIGFSSSLVTSFALAWIDPVYGEPSQDSIFWLVVGIVIIWDMWMKSDPYLVLMAERKARARLDMKAQRQSANMWRLFVRR